MVRVHTVAPEASGAQPAAVDDSGTGSVTVTVVVTAATSERLTEIRPLPPETKSPAVSELGVGASGGGGGGGVVVLVVDVGSVGVVLGLVGGVVGVVVLGSGGT
jgi:hypothetical protein